MGVFLKDEYPELMRLWDSDKNDVSETLSINSNRRVWWHCDTCGFSYDRKVVDQVKIFRQRRFFNICPICRGKRVVPEFNSLQAKHPDIVETEWDFDKNIQSPDQVAPHTNKKVWWKCKNGHSYQSSPNNKLNGGGDCPFCSHQKVSPETSLLATYPEIAQEWHPSKNSMTPEEILPQSNIEVWWKCSICGNEFRKKVYQRLISPFGCNECNKGRQTSVSEQLVYKFLQKYFPDAINSFKIDNRTDIDILLPSLKVGIEYDGGRYHKNRLDKDIAKSERILSHGYKLIRIREKGCPRFLLSGCETINVDDNFVGLERILPNLLALICKIGKIDVTYEGFDFQTNMRELKSEFSVVPYERSLEYHIKTLSEQGLSLAADWDGEKNGSLTPRSVTTMSSLEVYWLCPNNPAHKGWKAPIHSVVNGYGCKICSNRRRYSTEEWVEAATEKHVGKYDYSSVVYVNANTPIDVICPKHGVFTLPASQHLAGRGCPYCAGQAFHPADAVDVAYPELAKEWDIEGNFAEYGLNPNEVSFHDTRAFKWHCNNGKPHTYRATIWSRINGSQCAVCHGKQVSHDTCLAFLNPELAAEWCEENDKTPEDVTPKSDYVALWKCPNPNHPPYKQKVEVRSRGTGCVYCSPHGKKHPKDYEDELRNIHPSIILLRPFTNGSERVECQCQECGYEWSPFPYNLIRGKGCPKCGK